MFIKKSILIFSILLIFIFGILLKNSIRKNKLNQYTENAFKNLNMLYEIQNIFQKKGYIDFNKNEIGEYSTFDNIYTQKEKSSQILRLLKKFILVNSKEGFLLKKDNYYFKVFIPISNNTMSSKYVKKQFSNDQEHIFLIYCWPEKAIVNGIRTFCIDSGGNIAFVDYRNHSKYSGQKKQPRYYSAYCEFPHEFRSKYPKFYSEKGWRGVSK